MIVALSYSCSLTPRRHACQLFSRESNTDRQNKRWGQIVAGTVGWGEGPAALLLPCIPFIRYDCQTPFRKFILRTMVCFPGYVDVDISTPMLVTRIPVRGSWLV